VPTGAGVREETEHDAGFDLPNPLLDLGESSEETYVFGDELPVSLEGLANHPMDWVILWKHWPIQGASQPILPENHPIFSFAQLNRRQISGRRVAHFAPAFLTKVNGSNYHL